MYEGLRTLAGQLLSVPGAPDRLLPDFFSRTVLDTQPGCLEEPALEVWRLADASMLALLDRPDGVVLELSRAGVPMAALTLPLPNETLTAASRTGDQRLGPYMVSPLVLALTAVAAGYIAGDKSLRAAAPELLKAAQQVLLVAACRLCG